MTAKSVNSYYKVTKGNAKWTEDSNKCYTNNGVLAGKEFLPESGLIISCMCFNKKSSILSTQDSDEETSLGCSKAD